MDKESFFLIIFVIWFFKQYELPNKILFKLYCRLLIIYYNIIKYLKSNNNKDISQKQILNTEIIEEIKPKQEKKYEDKYLNEIRKLNKEFIFNNEEIQIEDIKLKEFILELNKINIDQLEKINVIEIKLKKYEEGIYQEEDVELMKFDKKEDIVNNLLRLKEIYNEELNEYKEDHNCLHEKAKEMARDFIIKQRLEKLKNCHIIEYTPLGNVLMIYDIVCESFKYYSDNIIPYRYLEVVARKYVKQFDCRQIYVDMEEELKLAEKRWEKEKEKEENENKKKEDIIEPIQEKKNIFAKFKSYNKEAGTGYINTVAPPKNSIPNKKLTEERKNEKLLLKEKSNRYTYEGKFANFSFIKKIDRKVVDKKLKISFTDFKQMKKEKII